ncbi:MAG: ANTAR domain-containing protein [Clostridium sp.]|nr:ANTAR domain-containing protein [Clostridium sp.]MDY3827464.1 ANTAR domain-containing protein [Clostridium sp.]
MNKVLIVCSSEKGIKVYSDNIRSIGYTNIETVSNGQIARRKLIEDEFDLIVIDTPLKDEYGTDLAIKMTAKGSVGVILVVKSVEADMISAKVEEYGVFVIPKPFTKPIFYQGVKFVATSLRRFNKLNDEKSKLLKKVEDIKRIDRAKCLLIENSNFTENSAHKYIEKEAMDNRVSKREIADKIINYYEV